MLEPKYDDVGLNNALALYSPRGNPVMLLTYPVPLIISTSISWKPVIFNLKVTFPVNGLPAPSVKFIVIDVF